MTATPEPNPIPSFTFATRAEFIQHVQGATQPEPIQPTPDSARASAAATFARFWTPEKDDALVEAVAAAKITGATWAECWRKTAPIVGNTEKACELRGRQKLKARIEARAEELAAPEGHAETTPPPEPAPAPAVSPPPVVEAAGACHPSTPAASLPAAPTDELGQYLWTMTRKDGWDMGADKDLMELANLGWTMGDVATDMGRDSKAVKARFELLTCGRRYKREDVLARLYAFLSQAAAE